MSALKALAILETIYLQHGPVESRSTLKMGKIVPPEEFVKDPNANWLLKDVAPDYGLTIRDIAEGIIELQRLEQKRNENENG